MASIFKRRDGHSYHIEFNDTRGQLRRVLGFKDKTATKELAAKIERVVAIRQGGGVLGGEMLQWLEGLRPDIRDKLAKWAVIDPQRAAAGKLLSDHIKEWVEVMTAKGNSRKHVKEGKSRVVRMVEGCKWNYLSDVTASTAQRWLAEKRQSGSSPRTVNYFLVTCKVFFNWLVAEGRLTANPVAHVKTYNERVDRKKVRRALSAAEIGKLLAATASGKVHHGMTGRQRVLLYRLAIDTGFRWSELRSLTKASFNLEDTTTSVTLAAEDEKAGRGAIQPIRQDLAADLKEYLAFLPATAKAFPMWRSGGAKMIRQDMTAAGIPDKDEYGRVVDFHALRHTFGSMLAAAGVHLKIAQDLMRHSTIDLTMNIYTHTALENRMDALDKLPDIQAQLQVDSKDSAAGSA